MQDFAQLAEKECDVEFEGEGTDAIFTVKEDSDDVDLVFTISKLQNLERINDENDGAMYGPFNQECYP